MIDLYQLLGIKRAATREEIRKAYRRKAKVSHPDSGGAVEAFKALATAHDVLSDERRRERYDATGEIETARPDNVDGSAIEVIAQKLGLLIHAEQDLTAIDIDAVLAQTIRDDIGLRQTGIANQKRAIERAAALRARVKRKGAGEDNALARVLDWHESAAKDSVRKNEDAVRSMERALEILELYSFAEDRVAKAGGEEEVSEALNDALRALDELAAIFNAQPRAAVS
jgi:curved DNA-binding protein CbpA